METRVQPAQSVAASAQIQPSRTSPQRVRLLEVLLLQHLGVLLDIDVCVLRKAAGGGEEQAAVLGAFGEQPFDELEAEGQRLPD